MSRPPAETEGDSLALLDVCARAGGCYGRHGQTPKGLSWISGYIVVPVSEVPETVEKRLSLGCRAGRIVGTGAGRSDRGERGLRRSSQTFTWDPSQRGPLCAFSERSST